MFWLKLCKYNTDNKYVAKNAIPPFPNSYKIFMLLSCPNFGKFYQNTAYYSGGQLSFDFLNDPVKVSQAIDKNIINTNKKEDEKLSSGVIFKTGKIKIIDNKEYTKNYKSAIKSFLGNSFSIGIGEKEIPIDKAVCMER